MNGFQEGKSFKLEKPVPGCLGRMVNIFELGLVSRNKLIADKPYSEGSYISRCQSDVARTSPLGNQIEGEMMMSELRKTSCNKTPNGTQMKTLIDQEMSKEIDSVHNPPSVVAKLMGLDALPPQQADTAAQRSHSMSHSRSHSDTSPYLKEDGYFGIELAHEVAQHPGQRDYKDIHEIWQKSRRSNCSRDKSPSKGRYDDAANEKKMALVRQKFMEAKCLATDEKLRQSKQFQDALEVLSANKDSFLKFLQEPNSLFSRNQYNMQSAPPPPPETKRITVLKPSKMVDSCKFPMKSNENCTKKTNMVNFSNNTPPGYTSRPVNWRSDVSPTQPTRIVVLKPSPGRPHDLKSLASISSASPRKSAGVELFRGFEHDADRESREVAKSIAQQMRENLGRQWRDENSISSVYPDGYIGDESSFNISETEYAAGNLSDSEVISPCSRHSWDYVNRFDSPLSSSFSHASYSPESSVCREAKKRLSERWTMMSSNGSYKEPRHVRRNSSTLGEMLALSDKKKSEESKEICTNIEEPVASSSLLSNNLDKVNDTNDSPKNLLRSKSVPLSSTQSGLRLTVNILDREEPRLGVTQNAENGKSSKSLFMGKVSSLFFSRNKRMGRDKSSSSQSRKEYSNGACSSSPEGFVYDGAEDQDNMESRNSSAPLPFSPNQPSVQSCSGKQISPEAGLCARNTLASGTTGENQDQPSPISILEPPFEEDEHTTSETSHKADQHGKEISAYSLKSNLIDKSPPIGSIARTLSWDDSCMDTTSSYPLKTSLSIRGAEEEEGEWLFLVRTLLSAVGLDGDVQPNSIMARWHSSESPLDPLLRDKYVDLNSIDILQEAKRRERRSMQKLVFDCANATLLDISGYGSKTGQRAIPHSRLCSRLLNTGASFKMEDEVWGRLKGWVFGENKFVPGDDSEDVNCLFIERVIREELVRKGWAERFKLEMDSLGKDLEKKLLDDLIQEVLVDW
ncbi:hypothetical protein Leryth_021337 [Lithospermum erythrorhizon]|nr:hypothetical protein Leryth_021337 [Lithospermum erythrorhizon]